jgi:hypothetical protein
VRPGPTGAPRGLLHPVRASIVPRALRAGTVRRSRAMGAAATAGTRGARAIPDVRHARPARGRVTVGRIVPRAVGDRRTATGVTETAQLDPIPVRVRLIADGGASRVTGSVGSAMTRPRRPAGPPVDLRVRTRRRAKVARRPTARRRTRTAKRSGDRGGRISRSPARVKDFGGHGERTPRQRPRPASVRNGSAAGMRSPRTSVTSSA